MKNCKVSCYLIPDYLRIPIEMRDGSEDNRVGVEAEEVLLNKLVDEDHVFVELRAVGINDELELKSDVWAMFCRYEERRKVRKVVIRAGTCEFGGDTK